MPRPHPLCSQHAVDAIAARECDRSSQHAVDAIAARECDRSSPHASWLRRARALLVGALLPLAAAGLAWAGPPASPATGPAPTSDAGSDRGADDRSEDSFGDAPPAAGSAKGAAPAAGSGSCDTKDPIDCIFHPPTGTLQDSYGPRPSGSPSLSRDQILEYALRNDAAQAADDEIEAMRATLSLARFAWVPTLRASVLFGPGVNIRCDDLALTQTDGTPFDFQYCRSGRDPDLDVQTIRGYFAQLGQAGVLLRVNLDTGIPIFTFGKLSGAKRLAGLGVAIAELKRMALRQEITVRVLEAHSVLLLARESEQILSQAWAVLAKERARIAKDLGSADDFDADISAINPDRDPDDLIELEIAEVELAVRMREARKIEALALSGLWALAGSEAPRGFDIAERTLAIDSMNGEMLALHEYQEQALAHRPEAKMASAAVRAKRQQEKLARAAFLPDIGASISVQTSYASRADPMPAIYYGGSRPNFTRMIFGVGLTWRVDFVGDAFKLKRARAELRAADHQRAYAQELLALDVEKAYRELVDARGAIELVERAAKKSWALVLSQQAKQSIGGGDFAKLRRALQQWAEYEFKRAEAAHAHNVALARLSRVTGTDLTAGVTAIDAGAPQSSSAKGATGPKSGANKPRKASASGSAATGAEGPKQP